MCIITYVFDELCCFYAAAMLLVLLCIILAFSVVQVHSVNWLKDVDEWLGEGHSLVLFYS
jgi:ABC-type sugar transport system permease subunit